MELTQTNRKTPARRASGAREPTSALVPRAQARASAPETRALGLGWFSVGLGLAQLFAPRQVAQLIGIDDDARTCLTLRARGLSELACGIGLLSETRPATWAWARVAGDVMDLALLGYAWNGERPSTERALSVASSVVGITLVDVQTAYALERDQSAPLAEGVRVRQGITVQRSPDEVYAFFRQLSNLPTFMYHLHSVTELGSRSRWKANGPAGISVEWEAELIEDRPGQCIAWRSLPGADIPNGGRVDFRPGPGGQGTELIVALSYDPPLGAVGVRLAQLFGREPAQEVSADLRRLQQVLETGEVIQSDASIHSGMHPARPSALSGKVSQRKGLR